MKKAGSITLNKSFCTTSLLTKNKPELAKLPEDKYATLLYLPDSAGRQGEGGLRTKGYFKKGYTGKPLVTSITVVYNGEKYLEETIRSIINQTYENLEYIIIDGGSTDGTLNIIRKYEDMVNYWVSEKDNGISDAFNKGVRVAHGNYINFQGDGDGFYEKASVSRMFENIKQNDNIFLCGRIQRIDEFGNELYISKLQDKFIKQSLLFRMSLPHQGLFTHISYFKKYGLFDVNNVFCMDYEHLLRSYHDFPQVIIKDVLAARWRADGLGSGRTLEIFKEYNKIKRDNKVANNVVLQIIYLWILLKFYLKKIIKEN